MAESHRTILVETHGAVGLIRLNRPQALNALCDELMEELGAQMLAFDADSSIGAIVLTGSEKAFAAGADIKEMQSRRFPGTYADDFIGRRWETVLRVRKPVIAAVAGFALGGGCELAMMCDIVIAADTAKFGQPEINLGIIPGAGGSQRLTRAVGKARAMDMVLTGRMMDAQEAERANLVSRVLPAAELLPEVLKIAAKIAAQSPVAAMMAKEAVNRAFETTLAEGVRFERRLFLSLFGTAHQREGMAAFVEKRKPDFGRTDDGP
ncbi:MAG TPA: enoyl-CoA hydratase [Acetobacteraceae bacterium]|nr:enoyl-CoA hydratase [Acetobacteraceae bacterium]